MNLENIKSEEIVGIEDFRTIYKFELDIPTKNKTYRCTSYLNSVNFSSFERAYNRFVDQLTDCVIYHKQTTMQITVLN